MKIVPIIMAGGAGTRLWPVSRESMPKQFAKLFKDRISTFQETLARVSGPEFLAPIVITNEDFRFIVAEQMRALGIKGEVVLEPARRDSAAAVAIGALLGHELGPDTVCLILAADHVVDTKEQFVADCVAAAEAASDNRIMTLGIVPDHPSTGYGYLASGRALGVDGAFELDRFVEKPDETLAASYVADGYLWNSGNFMFPADTMIAELEKFAPDVIEAARAALDTSSRDLDFCRLGAEAFNLAPKISIDYAVMEKTARAGVLRASFRWSDVGTWESIYASIGADSDQNVLEGPVMAVGTTNSLIRSDGLLTAVVGLDDVVVVTMPDAVLVAAKSETGRIKELVAQIQEAGHSEATNHLRMHRPWGWYQRIDIGPRFQVKHICVHPGGTLSLQRHHHRAEHWVVVHGTAEVTIDDVVEHYHENEAAYLPIGCTHRLRNPGKIDLKLIEVQVGSYTGEDDIVRIEDIYSRS